MTYSIPHLQVQGDTKTTYQKTLVLFSSLPSPGITSGSLSLNKPFLFHPIHVFCLVSSTSEHKDQDFPETLFVGNSLIFFMLQFSPFAWSPVDF
jgi:hypothetical protein